MRSSIAALAAILAIPIADRKPHHGDEAPPDRFNEATVAELQAQMAARKLTSVQLTSFYLKRIRLIDQKGPVLNSIIELNPDALAMAAFADAERRRGRVRGPLHGIPVLLKDNIDTGDRMQTTAGSFALAGSPALQDSTVAAQLRAGGAVILGKTNLSEWANFRSFFSTSGWSGRGGLTRNPYSLDRNACGSSSGSAAAPRREPRRGVAGVGDRRQHRLPRQRQWSGGPQAHGRPHQPRRGGADLPHPGYGRSTHEDGGRRGGGVERDPEPDVRRSRPRHRRRAARLARTRPPHGHPHRLHAVSGPARPAGSAPRSDPAGRG